MIEIKRYRDLKGTGAVRLMRWGAAHAMEIKRFDPFTGAALSPEVASLDLAELRAQAAEYAELAERVAELVADLEGLPEATA